MSKIKWSYQMNCAETAKVFCDMITNNEPIQLTQIALMFSMSTDFPRFNRKQYQKSHKKIMKRSTKKRRTK